MFALKQVSLMALVIASAYAAPQLAQLDLEENARNINTEDYINVRKHLMPCPFTGPKMFCASPNFLCWTKNLLTYCASHKHFVPDQKMICIQ